MSGKRRGGFDIHQMQLDWNGVKSEPRADPEAEPSPNGNAIASTVPCPPITAHEPVLRLRRDFRTHFPQPLAEVLDAGVMAAEDALPESVAAIHQEHGRRMLGALSDLDAAMDDQRVTRSAALPPSPDQISEPTRLQRWYSSLLGVYEEWFGTEAAVAFDQTVRAWHAHVEVVVDRDGPRSSNGVTTPIDEPTSSTQSREATPPFIDVEASDRSVISPTRRLPDPASRRVVARLPVPKPLPSAVAAGHFGTDEQGQPIHPSPDELYDITRHHADRLIEWIESLPASGNSRSSTLEAQIQADIAKYAEDFGEHAAQRLEAYCRRQAAPDQKSWRRTVGDRDGPEVNR